MVVTGNGESGFDSEREPEKRLPHPRKAAGAQITHPGTGSCICAPRCRCTAPAVQLTRLRSISSVNRSGAGLVSNSEVMINRDNWGHSYCDVRGEILGSSQDEHQRKHLPKRSADVNTTARRAASGKPKILDPGSMVAKLKLKGIDGRAPPGVEPAA
ncbi:hypothetical protein EVAR_47558_1 [Eumeta japonica]|uniref:Uncharacterized protein n=1 Tax=Eumeta variegata TaxID=151549 RepID=A0A4C1WPI1_EUMVA|nr:hypothetical protein EVAR_47558_1 [Eumeta japonica]